MDRSLLIAAGIGAALGLCWVLLGQIGWLVSGVVVPIALIVWVIGARWTEMGVLPLLNGAIPLPFLSLPVLGIGQFTVTTPRLEGFGAYADAVALAAAVIFTILGAVLLGATALGSRRQGQRAQRLPARRSARRG